MNTASIRSDFDEIAQLSDSYRGGTDRHDSFLGSLVPAKARSVLEIGCGLGRLAAKLVAPGREVTGMDLSPEMIARARKNMPTDHGLDFQCGNFIEYEFDSQAFDCIISATALHHMEASVAVPRMIEMLRPGGRLVIHDMRSDAGLLDQVRANLARGVVGLTRLVRSGRLRSPRAVRDAWARHCAGETHLTMGEARELAGRHLPGASMVDHWLWRYTIVWNKPLRVR